MTYGKLLGHPIDDYSWNECIEEEIEEIIHYWLVCDTSFDNGGVTKKEKAECIFNLRHYNLPESLLMKLINRRIKHQLWHDEVVRNER